MTLQELDKLGVHVVATYHPDAQRPWGYEVYAPTRFVREEANFLSRAAAEYAGCAAGVYETKRIQFQS